MKSQLIRALRHLKYSADKTRTLGTDPNTLSETDFEAWEGLLSRFARVIDIFSAKYLRTLLREVEPGFRGTTLDLLNHSEKNGWITKASLWTELKELRNRQAHEYEDEELESLFKAVSAKSPELIAEVERALALP